MSSAKQIIIIGGGPAGMEAAKGFSHADFQVTVFEKEAQTGGKLNTWHRLFPNFKSGTEVKDYLEKGLMRNISVQTNSEVVNISTLKGRHQVTLKDGQILSADAIMIATGFQPFVAERKEEYGYRIYENVITSVDLEDMLSKNKPVLTSSGKIPEKIAFIHCVGSRDKKSGNLYCSRVCCITGVKQAIEIKQHLPSAKIFNFYMDLRMYGQDFEEMYIEAQQKWGVTFIRGRVSEIAQNIDRTLQLKAEDTLLGRPLKMNFDLVVLLVGMVPSCSAEALGKSASLELTEGKFFSALSKPVQTNETKVPGIFLAGTCKEPLSLQETLTDARAASAKVISYLEDIEHERLGL
jgi:heterodisulfide reductase subunit A